ncbi:MAG: hypothetical protein R3C20_21165 [Planctomycetaceae bacterium]
MRLVDMGVEPFLVSSTVEGIMAQRLVRRLCRDCCKEYQPAYNEVPDDFPFDEITYGTTIYRPVGCRNCRGTGFSGRMGIYELLEANDEVRKLAHDKAGTDLIRKAAVAAGMRTLRDDGWRKVLHGKTSIDEVLRVTKAD